MATSTKNIKKMAQSHLRDGGYYSGDIDGVWGALSNKAYSRYNDYLKLHNLEIGDEGKLLEDGYQDAVSGIVVIDPGHGGTSRIGGSSANNAISASGILEKTMTLNLAKRIKQQLATYSDTKPHSDITVHLTRTTDKNLGLNDRAHLAREQEADLFLSLHFNGFNTVARGTETWILPAADGNVNESEDRSFAQRIQRAMFSALKQFDTNARDRGIKDELSLGVLKDIHLGNTRHKHKTRACLAEVEFIDNPDVDELLNTGSEANEVLDSIAQYISMAIIEDLRANS